MSNKSRNVISSEAKKQSQTMRERREALGYRGSVDGVGEARHWDIGGEGQTVNILSFGRAGTQGPCTNGSQVSGQNPAMQTSV